MEVEGKMELAVGVTIVIILALMKIIRDVSRLEKRVRAIEARLEERMRAIEEWIERMRAIEEWIEKIRVTPSLSHWHIGGKRSGPEATAN